MSQPISVQATIPLRPCGSTGLCIDLLEGDFFSHEEKIEVNRPKVSVPHGHGTESVNLLTLI